MNRTRIRLLGIVAGLMAFSAALVPGIVSAAVDPAQVPASLNTAIKAHIEGQGKQYAGLCDAIDQNANIGKYCAFVQTLTATNATVTYGLVLSDEITSVEFVKQGDAWVVKASEAVPAALTAAIKAYVEGKGNQYAGLCDEIDANANIGKYCAFVDDLTANSASVRIGRVLSDEISTVKFVKQGNSWVVQGTGAPGAPNTGTGTAGSSTDTWPLIAAGLAFIALAGGATAVAARKRG